MLRFDNNMMELYQHFLNMNSSWKHSLWSWFVGFYDTLLGKDYFFRPVIAKYFRDTFQNIDYRLTLGPGIGYILADSNEIEWDMVVGLAYQTTHFDNVEAGEDSRSSSPTFLFETNVSMYFA